MPVPAAATRRPESEGMPGRDAGRRMLAVARSGRVPPPLASPFAAVTASGAAVAGSRAVASASTSAAEDPACESRSPSPSAITSKGLASAAERCSMPPVGAAGARAAADEAVITAPLVSGEMWPARREWGRRDARYGEKQRGVVWLRACTRTCPAGGVSGATRGTATGNLTTSSWHGITSQQRVSSVHRSHRFHALLTGAASVARRNGGATRGDTQSTSRGASGVGRAGSGHSLVIHEKGLRG